MGEEDWVASPKSRASTQKATPKWVSFSSILQVQIIKQTKTVLLKVVLNYGAGIKWDFISPDIPVCNHSHN